MEVAAMAMPTSTLDQMARSTVAKRKSCEVDIWWVALMRIKVAMFLIFAWHRTGKMDNLVRRLVFRPLTIKPGRMLKVQSPRDETAACA
jgi:hypothetical protein